MKPTQKMIDRFLSWKLPETFNPDGGISFEPIGNIGSAQHQYKHEPTGTNLLDHERAREMLTFVLADTEEDAEREQMAAAIRGLVGVLELYGRELTWKNGPDVINRHAAIIGKCRK